MPQHEGKRTSCKELEKLSLRKTWRRMEDFRYISTHS